MLHFVILRTANLTPRISQLFLWTLECHLRHRQFWLCLHSCRAHGWTTLWSSHWCELQSFEQQCISRSNLQTNSYNYWNKRWALTSVAQLVGHGSAKWKIASSIPNQGMWLGWRFSLRSKYVLPIDVSLSHQCFSPSLSPSPLPISKNNKKHKQNPKTRKREWVRSRKYLFVYVLCMSSAFGCCWPSSTLRI